MLSKGPKQQPSGATCVQYLREGWAQVFGNPRTLRLDPAGSFRSQAIRDYCDRHQVFLDLVPGEAHWKVGVCQQAVQGLKSVMDKLCRAESTLEAEEALATAVRVFNQRDLIRGFSPSQHVLGQAPDETGRVDVAIPAVPPELLVENPGTEFSQAVARRTEAEKAHAEWNARQRLVRAANSRGRRVLDYHPGERASPREELIEALSQEDRRNWYPTGPPKEEAGEQWWDKVPEEAWYCSEQAYWSDSTAGVQVEVDLPHTTSGWNKALQNFEGYLVGAMRRRAVEVREKQLSEEEKLAFQGAKAVEVKNFVAASDRYEVDPDVETKGGQLRGMISGHVDDFLFGGSEQDVQWQEILTKIKSRFQWGDWERDTEGFTQCGVRIIRTEEGYELSQPQFVEALKEIPLNASRRKDRREKTTEREKTQLRALLGSLSWLAQQSSPHLSASVSLLLSEVSTSTVDTIVRTNVLTSQVKKRKEHKMLIHSFPAGEPLVLYSWVDAAPANRPDGGSTQGIFIGIGPESVLHGAVDRISPIAWHSSKVDRVCRSPGAAEAQAAVNGEDSLYYARYQWSELEFGDVDPRAAQEVVRRVPGCLITDSRNVYDKLNTEVLIVKGAEKRTDLEMMGLKESQQNTELSIRWVHSEAQLANSLTKLGGGKEIETYYQMGYQWRIVEDAQMRSARKRKQEGVSPLTTDVKDE
ncbi:unnamed protein product [Symbiodinium sp. KB8]|nr:unnamed protein product [Symbiodinium sp. KB8]